MPAIKTLLGLLTAVVLAGANAVLALELEQFRWMLEELRVSHVAQELKKWSVAIKAAGIKTY